MSQQSLIFVALDYANAEAARPLIDKLSPQQCGLKVGKELFTSAGPEFVRELVQRGFKVFLDLKFHDIPNTVNKAVRAAAELGVWMVNVHASGGRRMLEAARDAVADMPNRPYVIAVTVLTSMSAEDLQEVGINVPPAEHVLKLAKLTKAAGLDGVVCSAWEAEAIASICGAGFIRVTPGIRPVGSEQGDQRRVMTPPEAAALGIEVLVIGRPITQAPDPVAALTEIQASLTA
ncbi:orotidine-5'-phosphate decarboxylase [Pseudidiomarina marina]|uniref:Orotidine 5'-phosphate decarboxylase n=1 Tax=Pseudidiomarina marina TaxID=502366 RepID=A0A432YJH8_9GAMM|nr:orotidine-5'-phosphate decarboxylase [Pseudidiomarina marina]RUO61112.1 orotidine-5'-phosphate decarboxylase [Pseudidiomarina marina]